MTAEEKKARSAQPGIDPAPPYMRVVRVTAGNIIEGPWHDLEAAGWSVRSVRATCGVRGRQDHFDTTAQPGTSARFCPRCRALRAERRKDPT